jgi:hypothetical protein
LDITGRKRLEAGEVYIMRRFAKYYYYSDGRDMSYTWER